MRGTQYGLLGTKMIELYASPVHETKIANSSMFYGVIKAITPHRGFGFIGHEGGLDVYFHAAEIGDDVFQRLTVNQPVKFEFAKRNRDEPPAQKKGPRAAKIELIERMPGGIMGFLPQNLAPHHHPRAKKRKATWKRRIDLRGGKKTGE
jgi:cold shock CspA family protein